MSQKNKKSAKAAGKPPAAKCPHPEDGVRFHMVRDGLYDHGQYDHSFAAECQACKSIFARGQSLNGDLYLRKIRGEQDWFQQRRVTNQEQYFLGWLGMYKINYDEVDELPKS